jgi:hypothetical protein
VHAIVVLEGKPHSFLFCSDVTNVSAIVVDDE